MNTETFWQQVARRLNAGTRVFVSLVVANTHGSPGTVGARLLVDANGDVAGTIGGGIMEKQLIEQAHRLLQHNDAHNPELRLLVHRKDDTHPSGLICAGEQTNINLLLEPQQHADAIREFSAAVSAQDADALTLTIDGDGLRVAPAATTGEQTAGMALTEDGDSWTYRESSLNPQRMAIVGGGHCGKALASLAVQIGYRVDVFDDRDGVLHAAEWPEQARLHTIAAYDHLGNQLQYPALTTVVVMTASVWHDIAALAGIADCNPHWLGVMGSAAKIHEIRTQLAARGIEPAHIDAIHGPIGLPMKSDKPAEIAVSIMAQLLAERRPRPRGQSRARRRNTG